MGVGPVGGRKGKSGVFGGGFTPVAGGGEGGVPGGAAGGAGGGGETVFFLQATGPRASTRSRLKMRKNWRVMRMGTLARVVRENKKATSVLPRSWPILVSLSMGSKTHLAAGHNRARP